MIPCTRATAALLAGGLALALVAGPTPIEARAAEKPTSAETARSHQGRLDLNRATEEELAELKGVGRAIAKRIVEFRERHGPFRRVEDLLKVKGIGEKSFQRLRPQVRVSASG